MTIRASRHRAFCRASSGKAVQRRFSSIRVVGPLRGGGHLLVFR
jgi:hypothetical protein